MSKLAILVLFGILSWSCFSEEALGCTEYHEDYMIVYSHWVGREREREREIGRAKITSMGCSSKIRTRPPGKKNNRFNCETELIGMFRWTSNVVD
jgi:hypothetical protein